MIVLTMLFLFIQYGSGKIKTEEDSFLQTCHMEEVDFWKFFYWTFKNCDHLFLETFETPNTKHIIEKFLNELLLQISYHQLYKKAFTISKYTSSFSEKSLNDNPFIIECEINPLEEVNATLGEVLKMVSNEGKDNESQLQKRIRSFSADLNYRYIILIHDETHLINILDEDWTKVFPNPRGIFVVVFISTTELNIRIINRLFKKIWNNYRVLNIIFQQPCICNYKNLYSFDPFYAVDGNTWGLVKEYRIEEEIENPSRYRRSLQNLNWYPLKMSLFNKMPTAVIDYPQILRQNYIYRDLNLSLGFIGLDGMVLKTLCETLKLTPVNSSRDNDYGYELNGTFYGAIGEVANRIVDASFNSRYVEGVGLEVIEYLTPVINDKFCVVVPKASEVPHYLMIFHCFTWHSWLIIGLTYLVASIYWFLVRPIETTPKKLPSSFIISFLEVFCLFVSIPMRLLVTSTNHRIFFIACMIFNVIIIGTFQGTLVTSFSTKMHYPDIDTLEEFDKSGLLILTSSRGTLTVFGNDGSELFSKIRSKIIFSTQVTHTFHNIAEKRDVATMDRKFDANLKIKMFFTTRENVELLHIVKECPRSYHFTYILPKGSPYVHVFNIIITVLREAGLLIKWQTDVVDAFVFETRKNRISPTDDSRGFTVDDMQIAFYILLVGYLISLFTCLIELFVRRRNLKRVTVKQYFCARK